MTVLEQNACNAIIAMAKKDDPDYWTRLEHTYAGMAMQGLLNNSLLSSVLFKKGTTHEDYVNEVVKVAKEYAHALVEKMKEDNMYETKR